MSPIAPDRDVEQLARNFIQSELPIAATSDADGAIARSDWKRLSALGFFEPPDLDERGAPDLRLAGVFARAAGQELLPGPWLEHIACQQALVVVDSAVAREIGAGIARGDLIVSLPLVAKDWSPLLSISSSGLALATAQFQMLWHSDQLDGWILPARQGSGLRLVWLPTASGRAKPLRSTGDLWSSASLTVPQGTQLDIIGSIDDSAIRRQMLDVMRVLSAFVTGAVERLLELSVSHLQRRVQFGKPIGTFQALKHRAANIYIELEHSRNLCTAALGEERHRRRTAYAAKIAGDSVFRQAAESAIQFHGGMGFTTELPLFRYLARSLRTRLIPYTTDELLRLLRDVLVNENTEE